MKFRIFSWLIFLMLTSCFQKKGSELLSGNWKQSVAELKTPQPKTSWTSRRGSYYFFLNDSIVDTRRAFFSKTDSLNTDEYNFIGTTTRYRIEDDSLSLFNPTEQIWESKMKVVKPSPDTLELISKEGYRQIFTRYNVNVEPGPIADKIVLSASGCNGKCPIANVIIDSDGTVIFFGEKNVSQIGFYEGKISEDEYHMLESNFARADVVKLNNRYAATRIDEETISVTFSRNNTIIQSIKDYGKAGPDELVAAYIPLRFLFQKLKLNELTSNDLPFYLDLHYFKIESGNLKCDMTQAESFLLWDYLRKGTPTTSDFKKEYEIVLARNYNAINPITDADDPLLLNKEKQIVKIETDGRLYRIVTRDRGTTVIDIGFNFIKDNQNVLLFKDKNQYN